MTRFAIGLAIGLSLCSASTAGAQDYRGRLQGSVTDESKSALPGATITLTNDATGVVVARVTDAEGRYLFDFVDPGTYTITGELAGFKKREQQERPRAAARRRHGGL